VEQELFTLPQHIDFKWFRVARSLVFCAFLGQFVILITGQKTIMLSIHVLDNEEILL